MWEWIAIAMLAVSNTALFFGCVGLASAVKKTVEKHNSFVLYHDVEVTPKFNDLQERVDGLEKRDVFHHGDDDNDFFGSIN